MSERHVFPSIDFGGKTTKIVNLENDASGVEEVLVALRAKRERENSGEMDVGHTMNEEVKERTRPAPYKSRAVVKTKRLKE